MWYREHAHAIAIWLRVLGVSFLIVLASMAGLWLGERSVRLDDDTTASKPGEATGKSDEKQKTTPPLYLYVTIAPGAGGTVAAEEIGMAVAAGIHQYVIPVTLPWQNDITPVLDALHVVLAKDPAANMLLYIKLDPSQAWLSEHPADVMKVDGKEQPYASIASETWRKEVQATLESFLAALSASDCGNAVSGFILGALKDARWLFPEGYDTSMVNVDGFKKWLQKKYGDEASLRTAWNDKAITFDQVQIPDPPAKENTRTFASLPEMQRQVDFLQYTSESTADLIGELASAMKTKQSGKYVFAAYGYSYEQTRSDDGHFALARLLDSAVDGFVSPVSYADRGLGGAGGMMGPVDSVVTHGKQWLIIDDTRTGVARDPATGQITRPKNLRAEDVYSVQQRNFATALTHGAGLMWADPDGDGWLHDEDMWKHFAKMSSIYAEAQSWQLPKDAFPATSSLAIVVDEDSRFYQQYAKELNTILLNEVRDCALRSGMTTKYYLLRDVIDQRVPAAAVYLFLNAFHLSAEDRGKLHGVLQQNHAAAIWTYAPGYIDKKPDIENISATTRIKVKELPERSQTGSVYLLPGRWMRKDEEFGKAQEIQPLFYIDDPESDVIAKYKVSEKPSIGVMFFPEGWSSIYCADPTITTSVLRDILGILEQRSIFRPDPMKFLDVACIGPGLIALHAKETGERLITLDRVCDVQDLLSPDIGWLRKHSFNISLKTGETRLLKVVPDTEEANTPQPEEVVPTTVDNTQQTVQSSATPENTLPSNSQSAPQPVP